jgi:hypothetical protein
MSGKARLRWFVVQNSVVGSFQSKVYITTAHPLEGWLLVAVQLEWVQDIVKIVRVLIWKNHHTLPGAALVIHT